MITEQSKKSKRKNQYTLTPEEMWKTVKKENSFGIEGYEAPRKYYDFYRRKEEIRREGLLKQRAPKHEWPPKEWKGTDSNGDEIIKKPHRPNFLDDVENWANSYNGLPKGGDMLQFKQDAIEKAKERNEKYPMPVKAYRNQRKEFLKNLDDKKELKERLEGVVSGDATQSNKQDQIQKVKEMVEEDEKKKMTTVEKNKARYTKNNPQWPRCDRVTIVADAEYCGEQVPFYKTFYKEDIDESDKKKQPLFFPSIEKTSKFARTTMWKFAKKPYKKRPHHLKENESAGDDEDPIKEAQERKKQVDEEQKERILGMMYEKGKAEPNQQNMNFFNTDISKAYNTVRNRGRVNIKFVPNFKETEDYKNMPHKQFVEEPAPNKYFKTPSEKEERRMKYLKKNPEQRSEEDDEKFKFYVDRRKIDKKVYKPLKTAVY